MKTNPNPKIMQSLETSQKKYYNLVYAIENIEFYMVLLIGIVLLSIMSQLTTELSNSTSDDKWYVCKKRILSLVAARNMASTIKVLEDPSLALSLVRSISI